MAQQNGGRLPAEQGGAAMVVWSVGSLDEEGLTIEREALQEMLAEFERSGCEADCRAQYLATIEIGYGQMADQWEFFPLNHPHTTRSGELYAKRRTTLKEGFIVRYADDFKVLSRDWKTAQRWYHAVRSFLKDRLKLKISPEKSQIVNLRNENPNFLVGCECASLPFDQRENCEYLDF